MEGSLLEESEDYSCIICVKDLRDASVSARITHIKDCFKKNGLNFNELDKYKELAAKRKLQQSQNREALGVQKYEKPKKTRKPRSKKDYVMDIQDELSSWIPHIKYADSEVDIPSTPQMMVSRFDTESRKTLWDFHSNSSLDMDDDNYELDSSTQNTNTNLLKDDSLAINSLEDSDSSQELVEPEISLSIQEQELELNRLLDEHEDKSLDSNRSDLYRRSPTPVNSRLLKSVHKRNEPIQNEESKPRDAIDIPNKPEIENRTVPLRKRVKAYNDDDAVLAKIALIEERHNQKIADITRARDEKLKMLDEEYHMAIGLLAQELEKKKKDLGATLGLNDSERFKIDIQLISNHVRISP